MSTCKMTLLNSYVPLTTNYLLTAHNRSLEISHKCKFVHWEFYFTCLIFSYIFVNFYSRSYSIYVLILKKKYVRVVFFLPTQYYLIIQRGKINTYFLNVLFSKGSLVFLICILNITIFLFFQTEKGSALHEAALFGKVEVVRILLETGKFNLQEALNSYSKYS